MIMMKYVENNFASSRIIQCLRHKMFQIQMYVRYKTLLIKFNEGREEKREREKQTKRQRETKSMTRKV